MNTALLNQTRKIELHYFFSDTSHQMDAFVRNKCEAELLSVIKEIATSLGIEFEIDSEALQEGGLKEIWKFLGKNSGQIAILISIITLIISRVPLTNNDLEGLQIENAKLEQIERKLNIEKLKQELKEEDVTEKPTVLIENAVVVLNQNIKITKHKSNFYTSLNKYPKITEISTTTLTEENDVVEEIFIKRNKFDSFILESDNLPDKEDDTAILEIISPVLKKGKYKWKGVYNKTGQIIDFSMKDKDFKEEVVTSGIPFKNGTCIYCILEIKQKIDEFGEVKNFSYNVLTVLKVHDESVSLETQQGKKYRDKKDADKRQFKLFADNNE